MQNVLTLVTNPKQKILDETIINKVFIAIEKKKAVISNMKWLAENEACDIFFDDMPSVKASDIIKDKLTGFEVDFAIQEASDRKKKMLISDMDSTIIQQECIDEIADKLGLKNKVAAITERAMNGELDFKNSLRERVGLLVGLEESVLNDVFENKIQLMPGAKTLVQTMKKNNAYCVLVSGGFTFFTEKIAKMVGFHENRANTLDIENGKLTGLVIDPILDKDSKLEALEEITTKLNITKQDVLAVGDGANDLPMLKNAGLGIAYYAKPSVKEKVLYTIDHTDLKSLLYFQGYSQEEFING